MDFDQSGMALELPPRGWSWLEWVCSLFLERQCLHYARLRSRICAQSQLFRFSAS